MKNHNSYYSSDSLRPEKTTVQGYLDEIPIWPDGTKPKYTPMTSTQWYIWAVSLFGKLFEGMLIFIMGITLPLISYEFKFSVSQTSLLGASIIAGLIVGAIFLAGFADKYGRKKIFIIEMIILSICLIGLSFGSSYLSLLFFNFSVGIPLGSDYPIANIITSESVPTRNRGKLVLSMFSFQAVGAFLGISLGVIILILYPHADAWRIMYITIIIPSIVITIMRFFVPESPHWLVIKNRKAEAEKSLKKILKRKLHYPLSTTLELQTVVNPNDSRYRKLFSKKYIKRVILTGGTWFIQDIATYGIGIFVPVILATILGKTAVLNTNHHDIHHIIEKLIYSAKGTIFLDIFLILGMVFAVFYSDKIGRMKLQIVGFIGSGV
ncbi:MAG: MFS transporter, partial [Psittacicella sp.]